MTVIVDLILKALGIIPGLRKKPYKLLCWNYRSHKWDRMHTGSLSARQCKKLRRVLIEKTGALEWTFIILRESAIDPTAPPLEPPTTGEGR